jgi:hypothetical protein
MATAPISSTLRSALVTKPIGANPAFFCPAAGSGAGGDERHYAILRDAVRAETERKPRARRIFSVECRVAGRDCRLEVGQPDPVSNEPILAIFDLGPSVPYAVCTASGSPVRRLDKPVYSVTEFA